MTFHPSVWTKRHATLRAATEAAVDIADARQHDVAVWRIGSGATSHYVLRHTVDDAPEVDGDTTVERYKLVRHNPRRAPFSRWPYVDAGAFSEVALRNVRVDWWRREAKRLAPEPNAIRPYGVQAGEKVIRLYGARVTVYTYVVRRNPNFDQPNPPLSTPASLPSDS